MLVCNQMDSNVHSDFPLRSHLHCSAHTKSFASNEGIKNIIPCTDPEMNSGTSVAKKNPIVKVCK